jgi:hypothetical protein
MRKGAVKPDSLEDRLEKRIARERGDVFLRADFEDMGGYDQIGRALRQLVRKGRLMKIGQGLYTRAERSLLGTEALQRLGVETAPSRLEQAYNTGKTTQVPTGRVIGVQRRVRRRIGYNGVFLKFERAGPAPR